VISAEAVADARRSLGRQLAARRRRAGLSQEDFAPKTGYGRSTVANVETGRQNAPLFFWQRCDDTLKANGALVRGHEELEALLLQQELESARIASAERRAKVEQWQDEDSGSPVSPHHADGIDSPWEIEQRRRHLAASNVDEAKLRYLERATVRAIEENEKQPPHELAPQVREMRWYVDGLLRGQQLPDHRERLYVIAAELSGLLGALALDLGKWLAARAYGQEAFELATGAKKPDTQAWARATQSLIEYYAGNYHDALAYAQDGQILGGCGRHSVRLALNGEARALARLGDNHGVDEAVDRGFTMLEELPTASGVSPSLALGVYCSARAAANAATAYLVAGHPLKVHEYGEQALRAFDSAGLRGPQALTRLDLASALLMPNDVDTDQACRLVGEAMSVASNERFESVAQRAREFVALAEPWATEPSVREVAELVRVHTERPALEA
jgi:transcriptional regulator with XRE-family HTH domain